MKSVFIIAIVAVAMIGVMVPSVFAVQTIQGAYIPYDEPYGCISQEIMTSSKDSLANISLKAYTPNSDVNVVILADGKIIKNQSLPIKTWTYVSTIFELPNYKPEFGAKQMSNTEIKFCLFNSSIDNGEKLLRIDSVKMTTSSEKIPLNESTIKHSKSDHVFQVSFEKSSYFTGEKAKIKLIYPEYNQSHKIDIFGDKSNEITNVQTRAGSLNHLQLTETQINSGIFTAEILLSGPNGHTSYSVHGTSIPNYNTDIIQVTITDEFSHKTASASANILYEQNNINEIKSNVTPSKISKCTPLSIYTPEKITIDSFFIDIGNPDVEKCEYVVSLHDQNKLKIKTFGNVFFSKTFIFDETVSDGDYFISIVSSDRNYSEFFPLNIKQPDSIPGPISIPFPNEDTFIILTIIGAIVIIGIVIGIAKKTYRPKIDNNTMYSSSTESYSEKTPANPSRAVPAYSGEENPDFALKQFDFSQGLERVIEVTYNKEKEVDVKLFFSTDKDEWSTFVRNYKEKVKDNFIRLNIEPSKRTNSGLISGGNYEFNDDFDAGYTLRVSMKYSDKKLMAKITSVLRDNNFGCLPSTKFTVDAHRNFEHPTEYEAEKILASITDRIYQKLT